MADNPFADPNFGAAPNPFADPNFGKPRSALAEIGSQLKAGVTSELPQQIGQALQYTSDKGRPLYEYGKSLAESAKTRGDLPENAPQPESHNAVTNALAGGARMLAPSIAAPLALGAAAYAAPALGISAPIAAGIGAIGGVLPSAFQQGQQTLDKAAEKGIPDEVAIPAARKTALIEGAGEAAGNLIGARVLGAIGRGAMEKGILKPWLRATGEAAIAEPATEYGQQYGESLVEKNAGIDTKDPHEAGMEVIPPTLGMVGLMAPLGLAGHALAHRKAASAAQAIPQNSDVSAQPAASVMPESAASANASGIASNAPDTPLPAQPTPDERPANAQGIAPTPDANTSPQTAPGVPDATQVPAEAVAHAAEPILPSVAAGIDPSAGPLSATAAVALDTGAAQHVQSQQQQEAVASQQAEQDQAIQKEQEAAQKADQQDLEAAHKAADKQASVYEGEAVKAADQALEQKVEGKPAPKVSAAQVSDLDSAIAKIQANADKLRESGAEKGAAILERRVAGLTKAREKLAETRPEPQQAPTPISADVPRAQPSPDSTAQVAPVSSATTETTVARSSSSPVQESVAQQEAKTKGSDTTVAPQVAAASPNLQPQSKAAETTAFDPEAFDKRRADAIAASRATGVKHLDQFPHGVEAVRGLRIKSAIDGASGVVTSANSDGTMNVQWDDEASAKANGGSAETVKRGKVETTEWHSALFPGDFKEFAVQREKAIVKQGHVLGPIKAQSSPAGQATATPKLAQSVAPAAETQATSSESGVGVKAVKNQESVTPLENEKPVAKIANTPNQEKPTYFAWLKTQGLTMGEVAKMDATAKAALKAKYDGSDATVASPVAGASPKVEQHSKATETAAANAHLASYDYLEQRGINTVAKEKLGLTRNDVVELGPRVPPAYQAGSGAAEAWMYGYKQGSQSKPSDHVPDPQIGGGVMGKIVEGWKAARARAAPTQAAPATTPKPEPTKPQPQETRPVGDANNTYLKRLFHRLGIALHERLDITGEKGKGAHLTGAMPGTFRKNGMGLDDLGEKLVNDGWLQPESKSEVGNENVRASMDDVREFVRKVLNGDKVFKIDEAGELEHSAWVERESDLLDGRLSPLELADLADSGLSRAENEEAFHAIRFLAATGLTESQQEAILERAAIESTNDQTYEQAIRDGAAEAGRSNPQRVSSAAEEGFDLTAETNAEVLAREKAAADAKSAEDKATAEAEQKAKADSERDSFGLTGSNRVADTAAAAGQRGMFDDKLSADVFYSALQRAIPKAPWSKSGEMNSAMLNSWLEARTKDGTIKREELAWSGLTDYLKLNTKASRDQVQVFLKDNGVRVEETTLGGNDQAEAKRPVSFDEAEKILAENPEAFIENEYGGRIHADRLTLVRGQQLYEVTGGKAAAETKFGSYQLPGGSNYKELLLRLPSETEAPVYDDRGMYVPLSKRRADFHSQHFEQPNILAHVRFNERIDPDGKKVLFIEELQSDWAQKGRKTGFQPKNLAQLEARRREIEALGRNATQEQKQEWAGIMNQIRPDSRDIEGGSPFKGVPSAPFVGNTEAWTALSLKRMIRYASENGFDKIAWANGEQQAARYDLSKHVSEVSATPVDGGYHLTVTDKNGRKVTDRRYDTAELPDVVGKELADKIVNNEGEKLVDLMGNNPEYVYRGLDLKVGGEGMKSFYDKIIPNVANDVLKKLGGGRVGEVVIGENTKIPSDRVEKLPNLDGSGFHYIAYGADGYRTGAAFDTRAEALKAAGQTERTTQPGFDITPAMRERAMEGQPLFDKSQFPHLSFDSGLTTSDVQKVVDRVTSEFGNAPQIHVVPNVKSLPFYSESESIKNAISIGGSVRGVFRKGEIWLVAGAMKDRAAVQFVLSHELGHFGLKGVLGERLKPMMQTIYRDNQWLRSEADAKIDALGYDDILSKAEAQALGVEEALADMAGRGEWQKVKGWKMLFAQIRSGLRSLGINIAFSDNDIAALLSQSRKFVESGGKASGDARLSTQPQTETPAFRKWFADSKVVDGNGEPLVVYHGAVTDHANGISQFNAFSHFGTWAQARDAQSKPGRNTLAKPKIQSTVPVYLSIQNPLRVKDANNDWPAQIRKAQATGHDGIVYRNEFEGDGDSYVIFDPQQAKSAIGNNGSFSNSDDIRLSVAPSAENPGSKDQPDWVKAQPSAVQEALRKAGVWTPKMTWKERINSYTANAALRWTQGLVDQFAPLKELDERSYMLARLTKSSDAGMESLMRYGVPYLNSAGALDIKAEKGGLIAVLQKLGGEQDRFFAWIAGNRAAQLKAEGKENLFTGEDISSLKGLNQGQIGDKSRAMLYGQVHWELNRYSKAVLDIAEKSGLINAEDRAIWEKDFYVPFYRVLEDDGVKGPRNVSGMTNQYAFKKLRGGSDNLNDLLANTLRNWSHLLSASLKNQAAQSSLEAGERAGIAYPVKEAESGKGDPFVMDGGRKQYYRVEDPFVLDAISALEASPFSGAIPRVMGKFKHALTMGVTISPTFRVRNLIRDSIQAIATNDMTYNVGKSLVQGWKATDIDMPIYGKMLAGGALMHFGTGLEGDSATHTKRLIDAGVKDVDILDTPQKIKGALGKAWDWWEETGSRSENINRAAIYQQTFDQAVKDGKTEDEAHLLASYAGRDSMDFSLQGAFPAVRLLSQVVPFFNARAQGMYKLGREGFAPAYRVIYNTVTGEPVKATDKAKAARFGAVVGAVSLAGIALMLAYHDDDDWKKREEWDRDQYWWFKIGSTALRIPKPFEVGALGSVAERGLELMMDGMDAESRARFAKSMMGILSNNLAMNPIPQVFKPMIDVYANVDSFTGRPIETQGMEKLSKSERIGQQTSATAQLLGKANVLSPVQIDELIQGYFGWLGTHAAMTADLALRPVMGLPEKPAMKVGDMFTIGDFVKDLPSNQSRFMTEFYDQATTVQQAFADYRHAIALGQMEKAKEIAKDQVDDIRLHPLYQHTQRAMSQINQQIQRVQNGDDSPDVKREKLDQLAARKNKMAETAVSARRSIEAGR